MLITIVDYYIKASSMLLGLYQKSESLSFPRKRESITHCFYGMPAFAGMTNLLKYDTFDTIPLQRKGKNDRELSKKKQTT